MNVKQTNDATIVRFSATEAVEVGLPPEPVRIEYRNGYLDSYSSWCDKQPSFAEGIDKLIKVADAAVYH